ncbi:MAG: hypothetical protein SF162_16545 [bacterium]|nr:hypothetical protein [bacterium]
MIRELRVGIRIGAAVGAAGGLLVGLYAALVGSLATDSLLGLAAFAVNAYLPLVVILPGFFYLNLRYNPDTERDRPVIRAVPYWIALIGWVAALAAGLVFFMMPVTMAPIVFNRGVTFETVTPWYQMVFDGVFPWRTAVVGIGALVGFWLAAGRVEKQDG